MIVDDGFNSTGIESWNKRQRERDDEKNRKFILREREKKVFRI